MKWRTISIYVLWSAFVRASKMLTIFMVVTIIVLSVSTMLTAWLNGSLVVVGWTVPGNQKVWIDRDNNTSFLHDHGATYPPDVIFKRQLLRVSLQTSSVVLTVHIHHVHLPFFSLLRPTKLRASWKSSKPLQGKLRTLASLQKQLPTRERMPFHRWPSPWL